jgi:hypothetical protein
MLATVNPGQAGSLDDSLSNYRRTAKSVQGTRVPAPFKRITDTIGNIFQQMAEKISTLSDKVDKLSNQREAGVNLAKPVSSNLSREEKINKISPLIIELGQNLVTQNFNDHNGIQDRVDKYLAEQKERYEEEDMADYVPDPIEAFNAFKYNYEKSYGFLFLLQLNTQSQIKEMLGKDFPLNTFSSPIDVENELILQKVSCLKTALENKELKNLPDREVENNTKLSLETNLEIMTKGIQITDKNILPNLLVSVAIEPRYNVQQRETMVKAVLNYAFDTLENSNDVISNN